MDVHELKRDYPREFQKLYERWYSTACHYNWWADVYEGFVERMQDEFGLEVDPDHIWFTLHQQGAGATFRGRMKFAKLMQLLGHDQTHLPLYLAAEENESWVSFSERSCRHGTMYADVDSPSYWRSWPQGVFKDMPQDAWDDLVNEQFASEDWDVVAGRWAQDCADELYKELDAEYDSMTSEEAYVEHCLANDVVFNEEDIACGTV